MVGQGITWGELASGKLLRDPERAELDSLQRAFLSAVDRVTKATYGHADGEAIHAELLAHGVALPDDVAMWRMARGLKRDGYLTESTRFGSFLAGSGLKPLSNAVLTERGRAAAREADPVEVAVGGARSLVASETFAENYPDAYAKWAKAETSLRADDVSERLTSIGHDAREAMQAFATALVARHGPPKVENDPAKVKKRVGAVIAMHRPTMSDARREVLEALGATWEKVSDAVQRQEHGAQKEGDPLTVADARSVVLLTLVCMTELSQALPAAPRT